MSGDSVVEKHTVPASQLLPLLGVYVFLAVSSGTMVNIALPYIGSVFEAPAATYGWVISGFMLTFGVLGAVIGRLADRFGLRRLYLIGVIIFSVFAILNAIAPSLSMLIVFRILQGAGAAAMPTLGVTILVRLTPDAQRGTLMGVLAGVIGIAASIGPVIGGLLLEVGSWRLVFLMPALGILFIPAILRIIPSWVDEPQDTEKIDVVGAGMLVLGAAALMLCATLSRTTGLLAPVPLLLLISGLGLLSMLWWWLHRVKSPFIPPSLLTNAPFFSAALLTALTNACRFGSLVLVPIFLVKVNGLSPLWVGLVLLPGAMVMTAMAPLAGKLADLGHARSLAAVGVVLVMAGCVLTAAFAGGAPLGVAGGMSLFGVGYACIQSPMLTVASRALPESLMGTGNGLFMMCIFLGASFGALAGVTALEWVPTTGLFSGVDGIYSNALLALVLLAVPAILLVPMIQGEIPVGRLSCGKM